MFAEPLEADHRQIDLIYRQAVDALWSGDAADALSKVDLLWARLAVHIRAEHLRLFPAALAVTENRTVIEMLRSEHDLFMTRLAQAVKLLRITGDASSLSQAREIVIDLGDRLAEHNRLEEETVYRNAGAGLTHDGRAEMLRAIEIEIANMPPRFADGD